MQEHYRIERLDHLSEVVETLLFDGINSEAASTRKMDPIRTFGICLKDAQGHVLGGANGVTYYGCLYVDMLWISRDCRGQGWGSKLMLEAEDIGRERRCTFATVNTMDWEALPFYERLGYAVEFTRSGYTNDSRMYLLRKTL